MGGNRQGLRASSEAPWHPAAARKGLRKTAEEKSASEPGPLFSFWALVSSSVNVSLLSEILSVLTGRRAVGFLSSASKALCALCPSHTPPPVLGTLWCLDRNVSGPRARCSLPYSLVTVGTTPVQVPAAGLLSPGGRTGVYWASLRIFWLEMSALIY